MSEALSSEYHVHPQISFLWLHIEILQFHPLGTDHESDSYISRANKRGLGLLFISMENERKGKDSDIQTMQWFHFIFSYATAPEWKSKKRRCKRVHAYSVCVDTRPEKATTEYIMCQVVSDA